MTSATNNTGDVSNDEGFRPPPYPYDRLEGLRERVAGNGDGLVDLSIGTPTDPPPDFAIEALAGSGAERGYPASLGTARFREAAAGWMSRRLGVEPPPSAVAACVGTKELVAGLPHWLRLRRPNLDTVLYPAISYPTYAMGATLASCRAVPYEALCDINPADAERALCLWVNSPANPTGELTDLGAAATWGRAHGVPVLSDECYVEFTWDGAGRTILEHGLEGVLAVHSLSKRSNLAGLRAGFYAGDPELVDYLGELRKHAGFMVPGPVQAAAAAALDDDDHVEVQRRRYSERLDFFREMLVDLGLPATRPAGSFYLWVQATDRDGWALTEWLAENGGVLVAPGYIYGPPGAGHVRIAMVAPVERLAPIADRLKDKSTFRG